jgi:hypothetical protein
LGVPYDGRKARLDAFFLRSARARQLQAQR